MGKENIFDSRKGWIKKPKPLTFAEKQAKATHYYEWGCEPNHYVSIYFLDDRGLVVECGNLHKAEAIRRKLIHENPNR